MGICKSGFIEIIPLIPTLGMQAQYPILSHSESSWGAPLGVAAVADGLPVGQPVCLQPEFPQGSLSGATVI